MSEHTANTLKFYIGMEVYLKKGFELIGDIKFHPGIYFLRGVNDLGHCYIEGETEQCLWCDKCKKSHYQTAKNYFDLTVSSNILPILKLATEMSNDESKNIFENFRLNPPISTIQEDFTLDDCLDSGEFYPEYSSIPKLLKYGYGAIPNEQSPTGYVDIFGNPCVTRSQAEKRINNDLLLK